ncbi:hypothetical protein HDV06_001284 [Boothiomyces sp. JEL0866]|nr:hypothetical protein HDV06_001284 [Boothiomyces sp. JEL0866]
MDIEKEKQTEIHSEKPRLNQIVINGGQIHMESSNPKIQQFIEKHPTAAATIALPIAAVAAVGAVGVAVGAVAVAAAAVVIAVPVAIVAAPIVKACGGDVSITKHGIKYESHSEKEKSEKLIEIHDTKE